MKKLLFLLLFPLLVLAQNPTSFPYGIKLTNTTSVTATKVNVQESDGKVNTQPVNSFFASHAAQSDTGVLTFAGLTTNSATTINIGAAYGYVVDNETNPTTPVSTLVNYVGATNVTVTTVGSGVVSYVMLSSSGVISFQNTFPTSAERKAKMWLGKVSHPAGSVTLVVNEPDYITSPMAFSRDILQALGGYVNTGVFPYANGANLNFNITGASIVGDGVNFVSSRTTPNEIFTGPGLSQLFLYRTRVGGSSSAVNALTPGFYDANGDTTPDAIPGAGGRSSIQYIFCVPGQGFIVQYGQNWYDNINDAIAAVGKEAFVKFPNLTNNAILIGVVVARKDATALNNTTQGVFFNADRLGGLIGSTSGFSTATMQTAYNNSAIPQVTVTDALGAMTWRNGRALDTSTVISWANIAGTETAKMTGAGDLTVHSISSFATSNVQSGTTYTVVASDNGKQIIFTNSSAVTVTIPAGLTSGFNCKFYQQGTGTVSFVTSGGAVIRYMAIETPSTAEQYSIIGMENITNAANTYKLYGQLKAI